MTQFASGPPDDQFTIDPFAAEPTWANDGARDSAPSLPIILLGAACGLGSGMLGFYIAYGVLGFGPELCAAVATIFLLGTIGIVSGGLSALSNSGAGWLNVGFSCGLVVLSILFFGLCTVFGAIVATLILMLGA